MKNWFTFRRIKWCQTETFLIFFILNRKSEGTGWFCQATVKIWVSIKHAAAKLRLWTVSWLWHSCFSLRLQTRCSAAVCPICVTGRAARCRASSGCASTTWRTTVGSAVCRYYRGLCVKTWQEMILVSSNLPVRSEGGVYGLLMTQVVSDRVSLLSIGTIGVNCRTWLKWCSCFPPMIPCRSVYRRAVQSQREPGCHTETSLCCQSRWVTAFSVTLVFGRKLQKPCGTNKNNLFFSWDPFSPSDLNGFLSCVYDLRTGGEENGLPG